MSQKEQILQHLQNKGSITPIQALNDYGCMRLAPRIGELRNEGHNINTEMVQRCGKEYARYELIEEGQANMFGGPERKHRNGISL